MIRIWNTCGWNKFTSSNGLEQLRKAEAERDEMPQDMTKLEAFLIIPWLSISIRPLAKFSFYKKEDRTKNGKLDQWILHLSQSLHLRTHRCWRTTWTGQSALIYFDKNFSITKSHTLNNWTCRRHSTHSHKIYAQSGDHFFIHIHVKQKIEKKSYNYGGRILPTSITHGNDINFHFPHIQQVSDQIHQLWFNSHLSHWDPIISTLSSQGRKLAKSLIISINQVILYSFIPEMVIFWVVLP